MPQLFLFVMKRILLILVLIIAFCLHSYAGGPWAKGKGNGYAQFGLYTIPPTNKFWAYNYRTRFVNRSVVDVSFSVYAEYGLSKQWTLFGTLPAKLVGTLDNGRPTMAVVGTGIPPSDTLLNKGFLFDLGNITLGSKYTFWSNKGWIAATQFQLATPSAIQTYNPNTALRTAFPAWSFLPAFSIGKGAEKYYTYLEIGGAFRTHRYDHQITAAWELGLKIGKKSYLGLVLNLQYGFGLADDTPSSNEDFQTGLSVNNQDFVSFTIKWMQPINENFGVNLSFGGGLWANNVQQGPALGLAVYYQWKKKENS